MIGTALFLLFQVATGEAAQPAQQPSPEATAPAPNQPAKPKLICKRENITGTRVRQATICRTDAYNKQAERQRDNFSHMLNGSGNITPPLPPGAGG
jgi:hypothetical protein